MGRKSTSTNLRTAATGPSGPVTLAPPPPPTSSHSRHSPPTTTPIAHDPLPSGESSSSSDEEATSLLNSLTSKLSTFQRQLEEQYLQHRAELGALTGKLQDAYTQQKGEIEAVLRWAKEEERAVLKRKVGKQRERLRLLKTGGRKGGERGREKEMGGSAGVRMEGDEVGVNWKESVENGIASGSGSANGGVAKDTRRGSRNSDDGERDQEWMLWGAGARNGGPEGGRLLLPPPNPKAPQRWVEEEDDDIMVIEENEPEHPQNNNSPYMDKKGKPSNQQQKKRQLSDDEEENDDDGKPLAARGRNTTRLLPPAKKVDTGLLGKETTTSANKPFSAHASNDLPPPTTATNTSPLNILGRPITPPPPPIQPPPNLPHSAQIALQSIRELIISLPDPGPGGRGITHLIPPPPHALFPSSLIRNHIGGNIGKSAYVKIGQHSQDSQPEELKCPHYLSIFPGHHGGFAPRFVGCHGAMLDYAGAEAVGVNPNETYPLFLRVEKDSLSSSVSGNEEREAGGGRNAAGGTGRGEDYWRYCGTYTITHQIPVPVSVWKHHFPFSLKKHWTKGLPSRGWCQDLMREKGLVEDTDEAVARVTVDDVLRFFEIGAEEENEKGDGNSAGKRGKGNAPKTTKGLQLSWCVLRCVGFERERYDKLVELLNAEEGQRVNEGKAEAVSKKAKEVVLLDDDDDKTDSDDTPSESSLDSTAAVVFPARKNVFMPPMTPMTRRQIDSQSHTFVPYRGRGGRRGRRQVRGGRAGGGRGDDYPPPTANPATAHRPGSALGPAPPTMISPSHHPPSAPQRIHKTLPPPPSAPSQQLSPNTTIARRPQYAVRGSLRYRGQINQNLRNMKFRVHRLSALVAEEKIRSTAEDTRDDPDVEYDEEGEDGGVRGRGGGGGGGGARGARGRGRKRGFGWTRAGRRMSLRGSGGGGIESEGYREGREDRGGDGDEHWQNAGQAEQERRHDTARQIGIGTKDGAEPETHDGEASEGRDKDAGGDTGRYTPGGQLEMEMEVVRAREMETAAAAAAGASSAQVHQQVSS